MRSPKSSRIVSDNAAVNPIIDHNKGIAKIYFENFLSVHRRIPKVKMVVGQGAPNVGEAG